MSYPYGPEYYPTFEKLENKFMLESLKSVFYYELHRIKSEKVKEFEKNRLAFDINGTRDAGDYYGGVDRGIYPEEPTAEDMGLAFGRALEYAMDGDDEMNRFFQDLFAILEDKTVSEADVEKGEWAEDKVHVDELMAFQKFVGTEKDEDGAYSESVARIKEQRAEFRKKKIDEVVARLDEHDELLVDCEDEGLA